MDDSWVLPTVFHEHLMVAREGEREGGREEREEERKGRRGGTEKGEKRGRWIKRRGRKGI